MLTALKKAQTCLAERGCQRSGTAIPAHCKPLFPTSLPGAPDTRHSSARMVRDIPEYTTSAFKWDGQALKLAKMDKSLNIRFAHHPESGCRFHRHSQRARPTAISCPCSARIRSPARNKAVGKVGIDLGLTHFAILTGEKVASPNTFRRNETRLAKLQRRLAKKQKGSANRRKVRLNYEPGCTRRLPIPAGISCTNF